jgi:hypothetical protein
MFASGSFNTGTPVMFVMCLTYSLFVLGPWALVGNIVILLFYPVMVSIVVFLAKYIHLDCQELRGFNCTEEKSENSTLNGRNQLQSLMKIIMYPVSICSYSCG